MNNITIKSYTHLKRNAKHAKLLNQQDLNIVEHVMYVGQDLIIIVFGLDNV